VTVSPDVKSVYVGSGISDAVASLRERLEAVTGGSRRRYRALCNRPSKSDSAILTTAHLVGYEPG
jgi:hypothetical protein